MTLRARTGLLAALVAVAALAAAAYAGLTPAPAAPGLGPIHGLEFRGEAIVPTGTMFAGTTVGGLSSITYDAAEGVFYSISDDQSVLQPARFYTLDVDVSDGTLEDGDVAFLDVTTLLDGGGQPFAPGGLDPEGIALTKDRTLVVTSEGNTFAGIDPFVRLFGLDGHQLADLPVPGAFLLGPGHGVRFNLAFESAGTPPNGRFLFSGAEGALVQDGPPAGVGIPSPARLLRYNLLTRTVDRQYLYWTDPIAVPPVPPTAFAVNGLVELLPVNNSFVLAMERSFSVGVPGTGNSIKIYGVTLPGADDVNGIDSLAGVLDGIRPATKTLLFDLDTLGIPLDNVEGMTYGPDLPDGRRSIVLVSDNNFSPAQFTQFLLFAVEED